MRRNQRGQAMKAQSGFSIFELMIVMIIIIVVGMIAVPSLLDARENYRLSAVAGQLVGDLHKARVWAITKDADIRVVRIDNDTYAIEEDVAGTWTNLENGLDLPADYTLTSSDPGGFGPYGNGDAGSYTITNPDSVSRQVTVEVSGRIHAQ